MPVKRRNHGRNKSNKGHSDYIRCLNCAKCCPKDKAIKRFQMRNLVDGSSRRDIKEKFAFGDKHFHLPKIYVKQQYCIACGIHSRTVRLRSVKVRGTGKGERFKRYTTKLRQGPTVRLEEITGSAALPLPGLLKFLKQDNTKKE